MRPFERRAMLDALRAAGEPDGEPFDVLVIGGGITGVGVALDAAARGLRTALVERDDFASGTSSKSSKMVHGGLRYLQNGDVRLVYEALRERRRLMRNAPHLVEVLPFMIPILTKDGVVSKKVAKALGSAMWMYDLTGGWRIGKLHKRVSGEQAARHFPTTHRRQAQRRLPVLRRRRRRRPAHPDRRPHRCAARRRDREPLPASSASPPTPTAAPTAPRSTPTANASTWRARCIVNAAGVWADEVRALDEGTDPDSIRPAKGVHITIPWEKVRNDIAVIIPVRSDKRSLFLVPWGEQPDGTFRHVYVGTTDTDSDEPLDDPQCTGDDIDYVLTALNEALTETVTLDDITGVWAGMRPLVKAASADGAGVEDRRSVTATSGRRQRLGRRAGERRQADDLPRDGRGHRRRGRASTRCAETHPSSGDPATAARSARHDVPAQPDDRAPRPPTWHADSARQADEIRALVAFDPAWANPSCRASPTSAPKPSTPPATKWRRRSTTCSCGAPAPTCSTERRRSPSPPTSPTCSPPNSAGTPPRPNANSPTTKRLCHAEQAAARASGAPDAVARHTAGADDDQLANATD